MSDENTAVTAACIWENILEMRDEPTVSKAFDEHGTCEIRDRVLDCVDTVNRAFDSLETCDVDNSEHYRPFDWGFIPFCVEKFFNWTTVSWEKIPMGETLAKMIRNHKHDNEQTNEL